MILVCLFLCVCGFLVFIGLVWFGFGFGFFFWRLSFFILMSPIVMCKFITQSVCCNFLCAGSLGGMRILENTSLISWTAKPQNLIYKLSIRFQVGPQPSEGPEWRVGIHPLHSQKNNFNDVLEWKPWKRQLKMKHEGCIQKIKGFMLSWLTYGKLT